MKIYIAHNFAARQTLLLTVVPTLERMGHVVTSRWIKEGGSGTRENDAHKDLDDVLKADALLFYTDQCGNTPGRGKFFELGYAFAQGKRCYLMGQDDSCVFYFLQGVRRITSLNELPKP
jgi:nucleoside 2-deoxyribosyltransferase